MHPKMLSGCGAVGNALRGVPVRRSATEGVPYEPDTVTGRMYEDSRGSSRTYSSSTSQSGALPDLRDVLPSRRLRHPHLACLSHRFPDARERLGRIDHPIDL